MRTEELKDRIPEIEPAFSATKSGGPGGQNVVKTKVEIRFNILTTESLSQQEKELILETQRKPTQPTKKLQGERLDEKKKRSNLKKLRKEPDHSTLPGIQ
jgi:protein subunit release factor B